MKNLILTAISASLFFGAKSQTTDIVDSLFQTPQEQFEHISENLNLSEITTGLLSDKSWQLIDLDSYNGLHLADSNIASAFSFTRMFATLSGMPIDSTYKLPNPSTYTDTANQAMSGEIYISVLHYNYNELKSYALDSNLITSDGEQLFDVGGRPESPYLQKQVFLASPLKMKTTQLINVFSIRSDLFYTNSGKTVDSIKINFGDGNGLIDVELDSTILITYPDTGKKIIEITIIYTDASSFISHAYLEVSSQSNNLDYDVILEGPTFIATKGYTFLNDFDVEVTEYAQANITIRLACGHTNLQKPFIWVEGFNPEVLVDLDPSFNLSTSYMKAILIDVNGEIDGQQLYEHLEAEGYDLVYVDFADGGDWIQKNAFVVQDVIRWVNQEKEKNGSNEKNIVVGESMGGLVAKYALRDMEISSEDHDTKLYISLDSPHQGANIPLSAQYAAKHLPHIKIYGLDLWWYTDLFGLPDIRLGEKLLDTRAARQMLIYQAPSNFFNQTGTSLISDFHADFYDEYHTMGDLVQCETYMSSNGSTLGASGSQPFEPGDELIKIDYDDSDLIAYVLSQMNLEWDGPEVVLENLATLLDPAVAPAWIVAIATRGDINIRLFALPEHSGTNELIYKGHISCLILGTLLTISHKTVKVKNVRPLDSAPGGFYDTVVSLPPGSNPFTDFAVDNGSLAIRSNTFNYIPTYSSLDLPSGYKDDPYASIADVSSMDALSSAYRTVSHIGRYPYRDFFENNDTLDNSLHINFHNRNARWLLFHLVGNNSINANSTLSSGSFNFGVGQMGPTDNFESIDHHRTVSRMDILSRITGTAQVHINANNRIGFIATDDDAYTVLGTESQPTHFSAYIKKECLSEITKTLLVDDGGLIYVGYGPYQTGDLHILPDTKLVIDDGGVLYIAENSRVIVHPDAELILKDGGSIMNYGKIEILGNPESDIAEENGFFIYEDGAEIIMPDNQSEIQFNGGNMSIEDGATFTFLHDGYSESGQLRFSKYGESINGGENSIIRIEGKSETDVVLVIDEDADFWTSDMDYIKIVDGTSLLADNARLVSIPVFYADDCNFVGVEGNRGISVFQTSTITNSNMDLVTVNAPLFYINNGILKIFNSTFENNSNDYDVYVSGRGFNIQNVEFNSDASTMISSNNMTLTSKVSSSTFNGNISSSYASSGIQDFSPSEVRISGSTFNENYYCAEKSYGQLSLKCNSFLDFQFSGVSASNDCRLAMTSGTNLGYNLFDKVSPSLGHNIILNNAANLEVFNGSNIFDESGTLSIFHGTLQVGLPGIGTMMLGTNNRWSLTSPTYVPSSSEFTLSSSIGGGPVGVYIPSLEAASCGYYDGTVDYPEANGEFNSVQRITTQEFENQKMANAIKFAILNTELYDPTKNDLYALKLFGEILTYNYQDTTAAVAREWLKYYAYTIMKQTLQHAFFTDTVRVADNQSSFDQHVTRYVNVLNTLSSETVNTSNYLKQFNIEMDKAHLFHALGKDSIALDILVNMELCGVDSMEQVTINYWKYQYETEQAMKSYGIEGFFLDTNWVDTTGYIVPSNNSFGDFSSTIVSPNSVTFVNCSQNLAPLTDGSTGRFDLYPNPSEGVFTVLCTVPEESTGLLEIYNILGELVATFDCGSGTHTKTIDVSDVRKGVYIYRFSIDQQVEYSGKVVIQ